MYDSDAGLLGGLLGDEAAPQVVGLGLAPAGPGRTVKDFFVPYYNNDLRSGPEKPPEPEWLDLFSPDAAEILEMGSMVTSYGRLMDDDGRHFFTTKQMSIVKLF